MFFLEVTEVVVTILVITFMVTQIIWPILVGRPTFPLFKKDNEELDKELAETKEELDRAEKEKELKELKKQINRRKKQGE